MELKRKPKGEKVYRGAYNYYKGDTIYAEEEFEVYKDKKELSMSFFSSMFSRVATGELLNIYTDFQVSKDFIPQKVLIERTMGNEIVREIYDFDKRNNIIDYIFINKDGEEHCRINSGPKFHITTPTTASSMLFSKSKKEDTSGKNFFTLITSHNKWTYEAPPAQKTIIWQKVSLTTENLLIEGATVQATQYRIIEEAQNMDEEKLEKLPNIKVYQSRHATIPYMIKDDHGTRIQIKFLNDLDKE